MSTDNYLPVTKEQATESKISQSVKISKQLMKAELKKRMVATKTEYTEANDHSCTLGSKFQDLLQDSIKRQVRTSLQNDSEITRFRNLYTKFSRFNDKTSDDFKPFTSNVDMLDSYNWAHVYRQVISNTPTHTEFRQKFLLGESEVNVDLAIPDRLHEDDDEYQPELLGYTLPIGISQDIINALLDYNEAREKETALNHKYNEIELKLKDIDAVAEDMEARLLVQELSKSTEGKEALSIAGELVGDMLGDVPNLLTIDK